MGSSLLPPVRELGDAPAVSVGEAGLTYGELRGAAAAVAAEVAGAARVAVWAESTLETIVAAVGVLEAGLALVPVNPKLGRSRARARAHRLGARRDPGRARRRASHGRPPRGGRPATRAATRLPEPRAGAEDPALIVYTSGTTGRPKGAVLPRRSVASNLDALADAWGWTGEDVLTHGLPLFHVHGLAIGVLGPLRRGGELRHLGRFEPAAAAAALRGRRDDAVRRPDDVPPARPRGRAGPVDRGGPARPRGSSSRAPRPLPAPVFTRIEQLCGQQIVERYGLTETLMNTAVRADCARRPGYVGVPLQGVEVRLVADDGSDVEVSDDETIGEVAVRGPNVFTRLPQPARRDRRGAPRRLVPHRRHRHAGARRLLADRRPPLDRPDQDRRLQGRRGRDRGRAARASRRARGRGDGRARRRPRRADRGLGRRRRATPPGERELIDHVASELAPHKRPREVRFLDELPRNAMGKVVKSQLRR